MMMTAALLAVSLVLVRTQYGFGLIGILAAIVGYALRSTFREVRHIETNEILQDDRSALALLASTDPLTSIANRRAFDEALAREWRRAARTRSPLGVLMIDVDYFKRLNDRHGHPAGDDCLRRIAMSMRTQLQRPSDLVARYGGEEFVVLMPDTEIAGCARVAESIRSAIEQMDIPNIDTPRQIVTVSIGAASLVPDPRDPVAQLVARADAAVYEAKRTGRDRVVCSDVDPALADRPHRPDTLSTQRVRQTTD
jgi:diguanylate cyclase (GGDEF)-like protein